MNDPTIKQILHTASGITDKAMDVDTSLVEQFVADGPSPQTIKENHERMLARDGQAQRIAALERQLQERDKTIDGMLCLIRGIVEADDDKLDDGDRCHLAWWASDRAKHILEDKANAALYAEHHKTIAELARQRTELETWKRVIDKLLEKSDDLTAKLAAVEKEKAEAVADNAALRHEWATLSGHGCLTGDCTHDRASQCVTAIMAHVTGVDHGPLSQPRPGSAPLAGVERLRRALGPFAAMHRDGSDPHEIVLVRGVGCDRTHITSGHFAEASAALAPAPAQQENK